MESMNMHWLGIQLEFLTPNNIGQSFFLFATFNIFPFGYTYIYIIIKSPYTNIFTHCMQNYELHRDGK